MVDQGLEIELGEAFDCYAEGGEAEAGADPGEEGAFGSEVVAGGGAGIGVDGGFEDGGEAGEGGHGLVKGPSI